MVFGHVINTEPRDMYLSRVAMLEAGIPHTTPAMNVNRLCGSGAQAIVSAAQALMLVTRARAVLNGRFAPTLEDVEAMAAPVLRHRMALSFSARARGETVDGVIGQLLDDRLGARQAA